MEQTLPLPGMAEEVLDEIRLAPFAAQARKQERRKIQQVRLAEKIAGRRLEVIHAPHGSILVDRDSGECLDSEHGAAERERFAALLLLASEDRNHAAGVFDGQDGSKYKGSASLWKPSLRIDPTWMEAMRRRTRKVARERFLAMEETIKRMGVKEWAGYRKRYGWAYGAKMLTLTMPRHAGGNTLSEVKRYNAAFRALQKGAFWQALDMVGGIKAVEDRLTSDGPHVHGHFLVISRFIDRDSLRIAWHSALVLATRKIYGKSAKLSADPLTPDVRMVTKRGRGRSEAKLDDALDEVCKYLTKVDDLLHPSKDKAGRLHYPPGPEVLFELCQVARWPRMVEMLGAARAKRAAGGRPALLDTSCISVPRQVEPPPLWNEQPMEPEERVDYLLKIRAANGASTSNGRARPPSWRDLIAETTLNEWLQIIAGRVSSGIRFRLSWLRQHNPSLYLVTLDGNIHLNDEWPLEMDA